MPRWIFLAVALGLGCSSGAYGPGTALTKLEIQYPNGGPKVTIEQASSFRRTDICVDGDLSTPSGLSINLGHLGVSANATGGLLAAGVVAGGASGGPVGAVGGGTIGGTLGAILDRFTGTKEIAARCWELADDPTG